MQWVADAKSESENVSWASGAIKPWIISESVDSRRESKIQQVAQPSGASQQLAVIHRRHRAAGTAASRHCLSMSSEAAASSLATAINFGFSQWSRSINWKLISRTSRERRPSMVRRYGVIPCLSCCDEARKTDTVFEATAPRGGRHCLVGKRPCCRL